MNLSDYDDPITSYIENAMGEIPQPQNATSWSGMAVFYLSVAVELWASDIEQMLIETLPEEKE